MEKGEVHHAKSREDKKISTGLRSFLYDSKGVLPFYYQISGGKTKISFSDFPQDKAGTGKVPPPSVCQNQSGDGAVQYAGKISSGNASICGQPDIR
jgi:hypothetical protein